MNQIFQFSLRNISDSEIQESFCFNSVPIYNISFKKIHFISKARMIPIVFVDNHRNNKPDNAIYHNSK